MGSYRNKGARTLALFTACFAAAVTFILAFLLKLPEDTKSRSIRSLFFLIFALGFWVATLPAMLAPEAPSLLATPAYNLTVTNASFNGNVIITSPKYIMNTTSTVSVRDYNAYFYVWLSVLTFLCFVIIIWYVNLLRHNAILAMHEGSDVMKKFDEQYGSK